MEASRCLSVAVEEGVAVFSTGKMPDSEMTFIGASCQASAPPFTRELQSLQIKVPPGEKALVALAVRFLSSSGWKGKGTYQTKLYLIPTTWREKPGSEKEVLVVEMDKVFIPPSDRLIQLMSTYELVVTTEGQRFVVSRQWYAADAKERGEALREQGFRVVEDPNILLRFALGMASFEDLEAAASLDKRSQLERSLAFSLSLLQVAQEELYTAHCEAGWCQRVIEWLVQDRDDAREKIWQLSKTLSQAAEMLQTAPTTLFGSLPRKEIGKLKELFE
ncbi:MAG: hypothetical protein HYS74_02835 [Parcubacteria group bacterium]|nr:hypothetical protein [Parcubacteria group bacterium]